MVKSEIPIETEILLSDYLPQVFKIVKCQTKMVVLQKKLQPGRLMLEGYLRCVVYYQGEGAAGLCQTEQKLPFTKTLEIPVESCAEWSATVGGEVEYLNCRAVHPRRVEIRGAWEIGAAVFPQLHQEVICAVADAGTAQKQTAVKGVRTVASVDKLLTADGEFAFEQAAAAVLDISGTAQLREQKLLQGKMVVKGEIQAQLTCRGAEDGSLFSQRVTIPFVQTLEVEGLAEDCQCFCVVEPTGFTLQAMGQAGDRSSLTASALLHLRAFRSYAVDVVQECFSTRYHLDVTTEPLTTEVLIGPMDERQTVSAEIGLPDADAKILSCLASPAAPEIITENGNVSLRVRTQLSILYQNSLDELECRDDTAELLLPLNQLPDTGAIHPELWVSVDSMNCITGSGQAEVSASLHIEGVLLRCEQQPVLLEAALGEPLEREEPDIVLRACCTQQGQQVFDVARRFHVLPNKIMQANGLTEETIPAGTCLLIPCTE